MREREEWEDKERDKEMTGKKGRSNEKGEERREIRI